MMYGKHHGHKTLARKILRVGYYWCTIETGTTNYVQRCERCQRCANIPYTPTNELHSLVVVDYFKGPKTSQTPSGSY